MDTAFNIFWHQQNKGQNTMNYSPIYASLPIHRAVLLRDPFSWLVSKFFWHARQKTFVCDDIESAIRSDDPANLGWAAHDSRVYVLHLCGDDCVMRLEHGMISLEEMEAQAESNLRQSFSVVGLLNETDTFYDMLNARVQYVNMSLNPHVEGSRHPSSKSKEHRRCAALFQNTTFQERFKEKLPVLAVLDRLFHVGVEVNRFQREELRQCG
jgi:hypothetical protein